MKRNDGNLSFFCVLLSILLLPLPLQAVTVRFVTCMYNIDNEGNVVPAYIPFGECHEESLTPCVLEVSGLPDDEQIIHDYSDDTFSWVCGPIGGLGTTATILTSETIVPNTITQPDNYLLTFSGSTRYYIQRNEDGAPVLDGPFTATLEPANNHYSLSRPIKVVEVVSIQGHGKISTRKSAPLLRGEDASTDTHSRRDSNSSIQINSSINRDEEILNDSEYVPWTDNETIYAQPGAKINLNMLLRPVIELSNAMKDKIRWSGLGNIVVNTDDPRNVIVIPTSFGKGTVIASFGSNEKVMQIRCVPMAVHEIDFVHDIPIKQDTTGNAYSRAAWQDNDMDGASELEGQNADADKKYQPVAYCSTDYFSAIAKFMPNEKKKRWNNITPGK